LSKTTTLWTIRLPTLSILFPTTVPLILWSSLLF